MIDPTTHIFYKTWKDKGGNIGVQCVDCDQVFWTGKEKVGKVPVDPMTCTWRSQKHPCATPIREDHSKKPITGLCRQRAIC